MAFTKLVTRSMAKAIVPHFHNDQGVPRIDIGVREFMCVGASAPFDHPHVYLDMGDDPEKVCPYCSTLFRHDPNLGATATIPPGCLMDGDETEMAVDARNAPIADNVTGSSTT